MDRRTLRVPKPKGGTEKEFTLPLSDYLLALLRKRAQENAELWPKSPWVFPADRGNTGHISPTTRVKAGVPYTAHLLRSVFSTVATEVNIHPYTLKQLVNHSLHGVTEGYVRLRVEALHGPMQQITDRLRIMCEGPVPVLDNVVPIAPRKRAKALP